MIYRKKYIFINFILIFINIIVYYGLVYYRYINFTIIYRKLSPSVANSDTYYLIF